jgi:hypothetical protein
VVRAQTTVVSGKGTAFIFSAEEKSKQKTSNRAWLSLETDAEASSEILCEV